MRLRLGQITSHSTSFVCGVQILGPQDSWVRFGLLEIPFEALEQHLLDEYWKWLDREERDVDLDAPLPLDWSGLPPPS